MPPFLTRALVLSAFLSWAVMPPAWAIAPQDQQTLRQLEHLSASETSEQVYDGSDENTPAAPMDAGSRDREGSDGPALNPPHSRSIRRSAPPSPQGAEAEAPPESAASEGGSCEGGDCEGGGDGLLGALGGFVKNPAAMGMTLGLAGAAVGLLLGPVGAIAGFLIGMTIGLLIANAAGAGEGGGGGGEAESEGG